MKKVFIPRQIPRYVSKAQMARRAKAEMKSSFNFLRFWDFWKKGDRLKREK